ncbi:MAG TPA: type II toxin-antitoxin system HigB family toxin [Agitococcus sp.]|uniref:type II toxin-antitoxin system HigB family toxin n=1 Tax=uncultured Agitococcus sp. TaxID=1506599 RepID=UPI002636511B|nr:type II toxin-antitoxin system HigB family toxin [uncultured Agitococcus sp.]HMU87064.1 type II toxin-antitoxin system HigB family toxin [Agitococcus sp.]HNL81215.1 type II toxin-antitoxin system HigB family toxin [Agitococcus sp.]HNN29084.1 type II toxin-antitoxin system HigB family toxin [Agitococcus sp.]
MRVISNKALKDFAEVHTQADSLFQAWRQLIESRYFGSFSDLKQVFNSVDRVGDFYVFNIGGNKYRLIAAIHFDKQRLFIRHVFTHAQYDHWKP